MVETGGLACVRRVLLLLLALCGGAIAATPPHLGQAGRDDYAEYASSRDHRAFAIAPGGAWGWKAEAATRADAEDEALSACRSNAARPCVLYSVDGKPVFDAKGWVRLWGPYADAAAARRAPAGTRPGERFPELAFAREGRKLAVSDWRGKVVVLHFWGSWCGPCRREMPDLQALHRALKDRADIAFVLLQVREEFGVSQRWTAAQKFDLPFYDSGAASGVPYLYAPDGTRIPDREIAWTFPTTYVLDKRGMVVFSHVGPVSDWSEYRDFLIDAAQRSGR